MLIFTYKGNFLTIKYAYEKLLNKKGVAMLIQEHIGEFYFEF
jgi:hypothetical protein